MTTEYIDPDKRPTIARQNQIQQYGTIVFNYKGRTERVTAPPEQDITEQAITNAIIKVVSGQQRKVYFVQGHGERDTASTERDGYSAIAEALGRENYMVEKLVLAQAGVGARRCVGGRSSRVRRPISSRRRSRRSRSISTRPASCCCRSIRRTRPTVPRFSNLIALAHEWGMEVGNDIVVDASGMGRLIGTDASVARRRHLWLASDHRATSAS